MTTRILLRSVPTTLKVLRETNLFSKATDCKCRNVSHNLGSTTQIRKLFNDASKYEVAEGRERIYYGILTPQIRAVKWFSLTTSALGVIAQPFLVNTLYANENLALVIAGCSFMGFFTFVTPLLLHFVTKKYVTHLDYNPKNETYIASTVNFFCMLKEIEFSPADVKIPEVAGMFTTCIAAGKPIFLEPRFFYDPSHYAKIMGYDKPIDFKLYSNEVTNKIKEK